MATTARQALAAAVRNSASYKEDMKRMATEKKQAQNEQDAAFLAALQTPTTVSEMNVLVELMPTASKKVQKAICKLFAQMRNEDGFIVLEATQYFTTEDGYVMYSQPVPQQEVVEETTQEPEQVVEVAKPEPTAETRYRIRVKTFENEIKSYPAKTKKESDEIFSRESHPLNAPMENYQVQLQDSGRERIEWKLSVQCDLTRCGSNSRTREEYEAWKLAQAQEAQKVQSVASELDIPASEVAAIAQIAQQARDDKQMDRETFAAESALETVPNEERKQQYEWTEYLSVPKRPKPFVIREEVPPFRNMKSYFHVYDDRGYSQHIGGETVQEVEDRLRHYELVSSITVEYINGEVKSIPEAIESTSELTDQQRSAVLAQKRAESAEYLERMDQEIQAYIAEEIARMPVQRQEELQHTSRISTPSQAFLDLAGARKFIERAMSHYQEQKNAPGWFTDWLDDLYIRLSEDWAKITLDEMVSLANLYRDNVWMPQSLAVNQIYKLFDRMGRDTSGIMGY